jgi:hypothetical protein
MKFIASIIFILILTISISAQEKTVEVKTTTNKATGDTVQTESVIISSSEDITPRNNLIVINPLKFLLFYNISYFSKVNDRVVVGGGIQTPTLRGLNGFGVSAEVRFYPTGKNMRGFYFAPNISYNYIESGDVEIKPFTIGALVGWQWFPSDQFAMGLGIGADHYSGDLSDDDDFGSYNGTVPALRFDIGFAW